MNDSAFQPRYYILEGKTPKRVNVGRWAVWLSDNPEKRLVQLDHVGPVFVSTVFLGIDHNWFNQGPPLIFESGIFSRAPLGLSDGTGLEDLGMERSSTWDEALAAHQRLLASARDWYAKATAAINPTINVSPTE